MRDYYSEALRIVWGGGDGGAALELLNQAQAELARVRAELAAERRDAQANGSRRPSARGGPGWGSGGRLGNQTVIRTPRSK